MHVIWSKGFQETSVLNLVEAMGLTAPSVYLAFGSKEKLFEQAFQLHLQEGAPGLRSLREQSPGKEAIRCMLKNGVTVLPRDRLTSFGMSLQNTLERRLCPIWMARPSPNYSRLSTSSWK